MKNGIGLDPRGWALRLLFGRWRRHSSLEEGYSILLPVPADMPFLLRYALEGLRHLDTSQCKQIVVLPDGWGDDKGRGLRQIVESAGDSRIEFVELRSAARVLVHRLKKAVRPAANTCHWAMIFEGIDATRCEHAFLHDADAFFLDAAALERQYRECRDRGMDTLGVQARWDPLFEEIGYIIPGTWELMFSTRWARRRDPTTLKGRWRSSMHGMYEFDNMLYPQYLDFPTGRIGVTNSPPRFVHFANAVTTYRVFRYVHRASVVDEIFCLLVLAILEELIAGEDRALPTVDELARGLTDPTAPVTYGSPIALNGYPSFRRSIDDLCQAPIFQGARAEKIRALIQPFDEHFAERATVTAEQGEPAIPPRRFRKDGLA